MDTSDSTIRLANYIFSGAVAPGGYLVERELSRILEISRIPVREALGKLIARGVLVRDKHKGSVRMRKYDSREVSDLLEYREAIEIASVRAACQKCAERGLIYFEVICDQMMEEVGGLVSPRWIELDRRFHQAIVEASENRRFIDDFSYLVSESHYVFYVHPAREALPSRDGGGIEAHMRDVVEDHRKVVSALRARAVDLAVDSLRSHLRTASERLSREIVKTEIAAMR